MRLLAALLSASLLAHTAFADVEILIAPGDKITGTLDPASESERFLAPLPQGALLSVAAKSAKGGPPLRLRVFRPAGTEIADENGTKPRVAKLSIPATGVYAIQVESSGGATGGYALAVTWTVPKSVSASVNVPVGSQGALAFAAPAGAIAKYALKPARGSSAIGEALRIDGTGGFAASLPPAATGQATLPALDDYTLTFGNTGDAGDIVASVKLSVPKAAKRKIDLTSRTVARGARIVAAAVITKSGGEVASPGGPTAGASVTFPPGAVGKKPIVATLGEGTSLVAEDAEFEVAAGPPVFLGPEGATWAGGVTVTIPYDPALVPDGTESLRLLTRAAGQSVGEITGFTADGAAHTVTFTTTHFSVFQLVVTAAKHATLVQRFAYPNADASLVNYGIAVAMSDAWIAVGASDVDSGGQSASGAVFVHSFANGVVGAAERVEAPNPERNDHFGVAVAVGSDVLVVGASGQSQQNETPGGSAFVYRRTGGQWVLEQELASGSPSPSGSFGVRLALDGTRVVVAAWGEGNGQITNTGAAYVFGFDGQTWVREARLVSATPVNGDTFGMSVAIRGDTVAIGNRNLPGDQVSSLGEVTLFTRNASAVWEESQIVHGPQSLHDFGGSVALGDGVLVGGTPTGTSLTSEGNAVALVGAAGSFAYEDTLEGAGPLNFEFGFSCAIDGDRMLVGARGIGNDEAPGKVYSFERRNNGWRREATMRGADVGLPSGESPILQGMFGFAVALRGTYFLVGAPKAPGGANAERSGTGAAFLFQLDD